MRELLLSIILVSGLFFLAENTFAENLFYGISSFEKLPAAISDKPSIIELKVRYTEGPYTITKLTPIFEVSPESAKQYVQIKTKSVDGLYRNDIVRIQSTITTDPQIPYEKIFINVYFNGIDSLGNPYKSAWTDAVIVNVEKPASSLEKQIANYSQFLDFCNKYDPALWDSMLINERLLNNLCDFRSFGLGEKQWAWLNGAKLDWKNFVQNAAQEHAQNLPLYQKQGIKDSLFVKTFVSGLESFPPPMGAIISFDYIEELKIKHFEQRFDIPLIGNMTHLYDLPNRQTHSMSPLQQFKAETRDGIQCRPGLELLRKASDGVPACVKPQTKTELLKRGWGSETWPFKSVIKIDESSVICAQNGGHWLNQYKECEYVSAEKCSLIGGKYEEKSNCRHAPSSEWCAGEGIPVCTINDTPINNTEHSKPQKEITVLSISPKNVTLPDYSKDKSKIQETKIPINKSRQIKITNNGSDSKMASHFAQITLKSLTINTKANPPAKPGFDTLVFDYTIQNTDKEEYYAGLNFEVQFGQKTYTSELTGDEFYWALAPDEKRDASYSIQVSKGIDQITLNIKDQAAKKTLWSIPLDLTPYKIKYRTGESILIQE